MQAEISIHLSGGDDRPRVNRGHSPMKTTHWINISVAQGVCEGGLSIFGTPEQLDAFIDQIAALRTVKQEAAA